MSAKNYTRILTIDTIERAKPSYYGNPAFWVTFSDGTRARTATNAGMAYGAENPEWRDVPLLVTFEGDRIAYWEVAK